MPNEHGLTATIRFSTNGEARLAIHRSTTDVAEIIPLPRATTYNLDRPLRRSPEAVFTNAARPEAEEALRQRGYRPVLPKRRQDLFDWRYTPEMSTRMMCGWTTDCTK